MKLLIVFLLAFGLGLTLGAGFVVRQVQSGRVVANGCVYLCKDTGPVVR